MVESSFQHHLLALWMGDTAGTSSNFRPRLARVSLRILPFPTSAVDVRIALVLSRSLPLARSLARFCSSFRRICSLTDGSSSMRTCFSFTSLCNVLIAGARAALHCPLSRLARACFWVLVVFPFLG